MPKKIETAEALADARLDDAIGGLVINLSVGVQDNTTDTGTSAAASPHRYDPYRTFKFR